MASSGRGAQHSPNYSAGATVANAITEPSAAGSMEVNPPATPRSPPPLQHEHDNQINNDGGFSEDVDSEETDLKHGTIDEQEEEGDDGDDKPRVSRFIKDPEGRRTHDETTVDVVTVPCPGGDPLRSWSRDGLLGRYFGNPSMRDAEVDRSGSAPSWVRQGIRREADVARILLYEHPNIEDGMTLNGLADTLLEELRAVRDEELVEGEMEDKQRPVVFIGHSIGGIVVKMALAKASRDSKYEDILRDCYGVAFFGTPHQGSSYFAMPSLAHSIQKLMQLSSPLPTSITDDMRMGNSILIRADEDFKAVAHDLRIWTLYETIDSRLSGGTGVSGNDTENKKDTSVYFTAPLTSIKSAILGMRQERIFPLQSDHANVASFGRHNTHTLRFFLRQLAMLITRADVSVRDDDDEARWSLNLDQRVTVEVHGFFDDSAPEGLDEAITRAWSTRLPLKEFLRKGPIECLTERLNEVEGVPDEGQFLRSRGRTMSLTQAETEDEGTKGGEPLTKEGLAIKNQQLQDDPMSTPSSPVIRPVDASTPKSAPGEIWPAQHQQIRRLSSPPPPSHRMSSTTRHSTPMRRPSPLIRADFDQDLAIDRLSPPSRPRSIMSFGRSVSDHSSQIEYRDFPPFSQQRSRSTSGQNGEVVEDDDIESSPRLPEAIVAIRKTAKNDKRRASETVIVDEVPVAFARPDVNRRKFVWIHLPYNNPTWVKKIIETLQNSYKKDYSALFSNDFWASKHTRGRHSQHYAYFAKPGCYFTAPRAWSPRSYSISPPGSPPRLQDDAISLCLFLPYLHFDSYKRLLQRRTMIFERLSRGRARPVPEKIAKSDSMEQQVIWEYLGHDPPINCRRTLDQFGYPSLRDTRSRDDDQMLYKLTKERSCRYGEHHRDLYAHSLNSRGASYGSHGSWKDKLADLEKIQEREEEDQDDGVRNGNVLMVDQLWLWVIHSHTVLSFFPKRESDPIEGPLYQQADLRDSIFNEVNVDLTRQCENALDLAALSVLHAVTVLFDRASHPDLEVFRIFEEAISVLTEKLTDSLKTFRLEGFKDKASGFEPTESKERSIRARHKEEGRRAEQENRDNTSALLELRDLEDELLVLLQLFERQQSVINSMLNAFGSPILRDRTAHGRAFLAEALRRVAEYRRQAEEMVSRVRSTRDDYDKLLQMVQRQAQVDEVRLGRLRADVASAQSRSVMIFTTFTVIFLPLTFFTGLFGMNAIDWDGENMPTLGFIGAVSLPASFFLVVISLILAFSIRARRAMRWCSNASLDLSRWTYDVILTPVAEYSSQKLQSLPIRRKSSSSKKKKGGEERREGRRGAVKKEASDFWERHRMERERGYQIPEVNKKPVGRKRSSAKGKKDSRGNSK